jgi:hypothetical protein
MTKFVGVLLLLTLAALLVGWLMRDPSRRKPAVVDDGRGFEMAFSPVQKRLGWIVLGLVTLACVATRPLDPRFQVPWAAVMACVVLPLAAQAWSRRRRIQVLPAGLRAFSPWRRRVDIRWSEVQAIEWRPRREALRIRAITGRSITVPAQLVGMSLFESALRARVASPLLEPALALLRERIEVKYGSKPHPR